MNTDDLLRMLMMNMTAREVMTRNQPYANPGPYTTMLMPSQENAFRDWIQAGSVPFNPNIPGPQDYDMRGFWQALQYGNPRAVSAINPNDQQVHYPDYWKTPYHQTFSAESQWARPGAPTWNQQDQLVDRFGRVIFDDKQR